MWQVRKEPARRAGGSFKGTLRSVAEINALCSHITAQVDRSSLTQRERLFCGELHVTGALGFLLFLFFGTTCGCRNNTSQRQRITTNQCGLNNKAFNPLPLPQQQLGCPGLVNIALFVSLKERKRAGPLWLCACRSWRGSRTPVPQPFS